MDLIRFNLRKIQQMMKRFVCVLSFCCIMFAGNAQQLNDSTLMAELIKNDIKHPEIVLAQAKLETGGYTSRLCRQHGNLFGLNSSKGYRKYSHWTESVVAYKKLIQSKYKGGDYYAFLVKIRYATDKNYISKLKKLVK